MDFLNALNTSYLEEVLERYRRDPSSVDPTWRAFLEGEGRDLLSVASAEPTFEPSSIFSAPAVTDGAPSPGAQPSTQPSTRLEAQVRVTQLIDAYRRLGHLKARLDPLDLREREEPPELTPQHWGFDQGDLDETYSTVSLNGPSSMTLRELIEHLEETYARTVGCEFMHITDAGARDWLKERCERTRNRTHFDADAQRRIFEQLSAADAFEEFLARKFVGAKRFSLEGGESLIPMFFILIEEAAQHGVREAVIGMAHRGRLNVLVNVLKKARRAVFQEFTDEGADDLIGRGDVKYHLGFESDHTTRHGDEVKLTMACNPSHLEAINPVVEGITRARQDRLGLLKGRHEIMPVLVHGDAAFIGQGLVAETLNLMSLPGYSTGGTIHIVVNNQIGFTTEPRDGRSTTYCTDIAKMLEVPIFHVNGEDPEAVLHVMRIAAEFRQRFQRDVIVDMYCFRRYGHNEADEPRFTNPRMYQAVDDHPDVHEQYAEHLRNLGALTRDEIDGIYSEQNEILEKEMEMLHQGMVDAPAERGDDVAQYVWDDEVAIADTSIPRGWIPEIASTITTLPEHFTPHRIIQRLLDRRVEMGSGERPADWGFAEALAFASLVREGTSVRISGQEAQRGTFGHRHAVLHDQDDGTEYTPIAQLAEKPTRFEVYNSPLSEASVLGFEYGYASDSPKALVIWEAQFGDFANGAQVIIDQFIAASEDKWAQRSGVVLLLPHGYEGQGPEHSSARFERFLQACAEDNIQVCNLTTPAQIFHALRRQVKRAFFKPLVVMSPKSLLRHRKAVSPLSELTEGRFHRVLPDPDLGEDDLVTRAVICTGKVYYDLLERREELGDAGAETAIIRIEQLYPFPGERLRETVLRYNTLEEIVWCQEEPRNMGAFAFLYPRFDKLFSDAPRVRWVSRPASASPATGSKKAHKIEQKQLVDQALGVAESE